MALVYGTSDLSAGQVNWNPSHFPGEAQLLNSCLSLLVPASGCQVGRGGSPGSSGRLTGIRVAAPFSPGEAPHLSCLLPATIQLGIGGSCTGSHVYKVSFPSELPPTAEFSCFTLVLKTVGLHLPLDWVLW